MLKLNLFVMDEIHVALKNIRRVDASLPVDAAPPSCKMDGETARGRSTPDAASAFPVPSLLDAAAGRRPGQPTVAASVLPSVPASSMVP